MKLKPDPGICSYGTLILLKHVTDISKEVDGVIEAKDIESIHRMRVASRRLRSALPLFADCLPAKGTLAWQKQIKAITRSLGAARDTDVQIEHVDKIYQGLEDARYKPGIHRLLVRLKQQRAKLQDKVTASLNNLINNKTLLDMEARLSKNASQTEEIAPFSHSLYALAHNAVLNRLDKLLSYDEIVYQPEKVTELHQMRIASKWLRYTLEIFSRLYSNKLKSYIQVGRKIQESLGTIHDDDVWLQVLPVIGEKERKKTLSYYGDIRPINRLLPGFEYFQQLCQKEREKTYREFVQDWQRWKERGLWEKLRQTIELPVTISANIYPPPPPVEEIS